MTRSDLALGSRIGVHHVTDPIDPYSAAAATPDEAHSAEPADRPDLITEIAAIPHSVWAMQRELKALLDLLAETFTPRPWSNAGWLSNVAGTALGATAWVRALSSSVTSKGGMEIGDVVVGTDGGQTVELRAVPNDTYDTTIPTRLLGTVRTTASQLTVPFQTPIVLHPGESLILVCISSATVHFDFSCRYREMRS